MIKASQVSTAASVAMAVEEQVRLVRAQEVKARRAGLHEQADALVKAADALSRAGMTFDSAARQAFVAARRGELLS